MGSGREVSPRAHSKARKQEWPHWDKLRVLHSWVYLAKLWHSLAYWRNLVYINMSALNEPGLMPHT